MNTFHQEKTLRVRREIAQRLVEVLRWQSASTARCICPGGHTDALLFLDDNPVPRVFCLHERCQDEVAEVNRELRRLLVGDGWIKAKPDRQKLAEWRWHGQLEAAARNRTLPPLLALPPVTDEEWLKRSPVAIPDDPLAQAKLFLESLFAPEMIVWCGRLDDSGEEWHRPNFKTVAEWLAVRVHPGPQTSTVEYLPGKIYSRAKKNQWKRHFYVVESDTLDREAFGNVQLHVAKTYGLHAVIFTGNRSNQAWFRYNYQPDGEPTPPLPELPHGHPYRRWWEKAIHLPENQGKSPQDIQRQFPDYKTLVKELKAMNTEMSKYAGELLAIVQAPPRKLRKPKGRAVAVPEQPQQTEKQVETTTGNREGCPDVDARPSQR